MNSHDSDRMQSETQVSDEQAAALSKVYALLLALVDQRREDEVTTAIGDQLTDETPMTAEDVPEESENRHNDSI